MGRATIAVFFGGGANEIRTRDLLNAIQTRYQLRYNPDLFRYYGYVVVH